MSNVNILIVDDEKESLDVLERIVKRHGYGTIRAQSGREALYKMSENPAPVVFLDLKMPEMDGLQVLEKFQEKYSDRTCVFMLTGFADIATAVQALQMGAEDYLQKPSRLEEIDFKLERALRYRNTMRENRRLQEEFAERYGLRSIIGEQTGLREVFRDIDKVAPTEANVLVVGEAGTGKELIARTIHSRSLRAARPFVAVNCPALPKRLVESELLGYDQGAFTDAKEGGKIGRFEMAERGTLFLDEITRLPLTVQEKLLRPLQIREYEKVGGTVTLSVDIRFIAATCQDVGKLMAEGKFLPELYERLNVVQIRVPALRERKEDIPALVDLFLKRYAWETKRNVGKIAPETLDALTRYSYPGNVRELENIIERAVILCEGDIITSADLPVNVPRMDGGTAVGAQQEDADKPFKEAQNDWEKSYLISVLRRANGVVKVAAVAAGMDLRNFRRKMAKHGLNRREYMEK